MGQDITVKKYWRKKMKTVLGAIAGAAAVIGCALIRKGGKNEGKK